MPRRKKVRSKKTTAETLSETEEDEVDEVESLPQTQPSPPIQEENRSFSFTEADFPSKGELIIGKCTEITQHGAFFLLEGYEKLGGKAGFVHISELSKTWIRNIRKHIKEGQKSVFKVLRINPQRGEVDLSIRRVTDAQKRGTLKIFKQESRARTIIGMVKNQLNLTDEAVENFTDILYSNFGQLYTALEKARDSSYETLEKVGIEPEIAKLATELATKELERLSVSLNGKLRCSLYVKDGLEIFKDAILKAISAAKKNEAIGISVQNISAPDYRITLEADDWKRAEKSWKAFQSSFEKSISKHSPLVLEFTRL